MEEDLNAIAADCLVISCCCQCLILQLLIVILLKLPYKFFRGALAFAKRKLRNPRKAKKIKNVKKTRRKKKRLLCHDQESISHTGPSSSNNEEPQLPTFGSCNMDEVDKVLEEFFDRGEFGFGRFWDAGEERFPTCLDHHHHQELDYDVVSYHLIRMFGSCSSNGIDHQSLFQL